MPRPTMPVLSHFLAGRARMLALGAMLVLAGCSTPPPPAVSSRQQQAWAGRMGLQVHDPLAPERSFSASFHLQGTPDNGRLDIFNPLGSQIAKLEWQPGGASLQQGDRITESTSLQELLERSLGTPLPLEALFGWLRGLQTSAPGWQVDLSRYAQGRITAQRLSPPPTATLQLLLQAPE